MHRASEENVSIICEPGSSYFGNVKPSRVSGKAISRKIFQKWARGLRFCFQASMACGSVERTLSVLSLTILAK